MDDTAMDGRPLVHAVEHPLLDKVKACSADPVKAADFFLTILHPLHTSRNVSNHPYLKPTYLKMLREFPLPDTHPYRESSSKESLADGSDQKTGVASLTLWLVLQSFLVCSLRRAWSSCGKAAYLSTGMLASVQGKGNAAIATVGATLGYVLLHAIFGCVITTMNPGNVVLTQAAYSFL